MDRKQLSERDICTKFITPAILQAGWQQNQFREEVKLTQGRVMVRGKMAQHRQFLEPVLTPEEKEAQDRIADDIIAEILREEDSE